ncbi:MAG: hypothetical protein MI919_13755, partial [Holophagales bacterium]|nr:hypothetical protein [Holophagales bacterium]
MFNRLKLRYKVLLSPLIAVLGFAIILLVVTVTGAEVERLASEIRDSWMPGLSLTQKVQNDFFSIQQGAFIDWVETLGFDGPDRAAELKDGIDTALEEAKMNDTFDSAKVEDLKIAFDSYYDRAYGIIERAVAAAEADEANNVDQQLLQEMVEPYQLFAGKLQEFVEDYEKSLRDELDTLRQKQHDARLVIFGSSLAIMALLIVTALLLFRNINMPVNRAVQVADHLSQG